MSVMPKSASNNAVANGVNGEIHETITIAVDASLTRGGGLLVLPKIRKIYFYSCSWSPLIIFPNTSKIHLFNAAVALEMFEEYLDRYPREMKSEDDGGEPKEKLVCETKSLKSSCEDEDSNQDNNSLFHLSKRYKDFLENLEEKLKSEPFFGTWNYHDIKREDGKNNDNDKDLLKTCKILAEEDYKSIGNLPIITEAPQFSGYSIENISESVGAALALVSVVLNFPR